MEMSRLTLDGTTETVSRDQILRRERGLTRKYSFSLFSWLRAGLVTLPGWSLRLLYVMTIYTYRKERSKRPHHSKRPGALKIAKTRKNGANAPGALIFLFLLKTAPGTLQTPRGVLFRAFREEGLVGRAHDTRSCAKVYIWGASVCRSPDKYQVLSKEPSSFRLALTSLCDLPLLFVYFKVKNGVLYYLDYVEDIYIRTLCVPVSTLNPNIVFTTSNKL